MKFSILALTAVVSLSTAQNLSGEPACATSCLISAISAAGCAPSDVPCQCGISAGAVGPCLTGACNANDLSQALSVGLALCSSYSAAHNISSTSVPLNATTSTVVSTSATPYSNSTTVTARTTSFTSTKAKTTGGSGATATPSTTSSKAGAPALVAGIGGVVGMLGMLAAL